MAASDHLQPQQFDVTVSTHEDLRKGIVAKKLPGSQHKHHRVTVSGEYGNDAELIAGQMAQATSGYVTGIYPRI